MMVVYISVRLRFTQEVQVDQILPLGRIGNPESMDHPKDHSLFGLGLPGFIVFFFLNQASMITTNHHHF